jgi:hypothetical protein
MRAAGISYASDKDYCLLLHQSSSCSRNDGATGLVIVLNVDGWPLLRAGK